MFACSAVVTGGGATQTDYTGHQTKTLIPQDRRRLSRSGHRSWWRQCLGRVWSCDGLHEWGPAGVVALFAISFSLL